jgi:hypothetical protein
MRVMRMWLQLEISTHSIQLGKNVLELLLHKVVHLQLLQTVICLSFHPLLLKKIIFYQILLS